MPKLLEETEIRLEYADMGRLVRKERVSDMARSSGIHLSGVIKYVMVSCGLLTPDDDTTEEMPLRMWVGMAWEAMVVQLWPEIVWQPGEVSLDGIVGSPDGVTHQGDHIVLEEFKATWMSRAEPGQKGPVKAPRNILNMKRWMLQIAGYCHMMKLTRARLHVLWVNGDYTYGPRGGPAYYVYLIEFTEAELERMWRNMILANVGGAVPEQH